MGNILDGIIKKNISRRSFLKASAVGTATLALPGCSSNALSEAGVGAEAANKEGEWVPASCEQNCGGRCVNLVYVVDNVVVRQKTDDSHPDSPDYPQQRSCQRGHSRRQEIFAADRLKYPMKRKHWEPGGGQKELRGIDDWERISWDEALDIVATELKKYYKEYGPRSIFLPDQGQSRKWSRAGAAPLALYGGFVSGGNDTTSWGSFSMTPAMIGMPKFATAKTSDRFDLRKSDTIVLYSTNPAWANGGNPTYNIQQAKAAGANFIFVGPEYNVTASMLEAKWIRVRPGTDTAFLLAVAYAMLDEDNPETNPLIDWDFLDTYTVGFDGEHLPKDAKVNENFKDYILGEYDGIPKTPEWASEISGTPVEDIKWFAREMRKDRKVALLCSFAAARTNHSNDLPQIFMTIGAMGGHFGKEGHSCGGGWFHFGCGNVGSALVALGNNGLPVIPNPLDDVVNAPQQWKAILDGKFNCTGNQFDGVFLPEDIRTWDPRVIYHCFSATLNTSKGILDGIKAHRKVDFVVSFAQFYTMNAQYSDIVLPITTQWERLNPPDRMTANREVAYFPSRIIEPLYEAKSDQWISKELAKRLGIDPKEIYPFDETQQYFNLIATSKVVEEDGITYSPLVTITDSDIKEWGVEGTPQQGKIGLKELLAQGVYQVERKEGDKYTAIGYQDYIQDPEKNPLPSNSGKFEIYCQKKADALNAFGYDDNVYKPYPTYHVPMEGYEETFIDWENKIKGDFPYQVFNPKYPRRAHTNYDNVPWLREAFPNPVFISVSDAQEKGVKDGDTVLITSKYGKTLRKASLTQRLVPGVIGLPHGAWADIDEKTGIDKAGSDNILTGQVTSGQGLSSYNSCIVNFEKFTGEQLTPDCELPPRIVNLV
ncbi:MAG: molybdopterin-dependent oxidoreductase [Desulfitobacterium sp.]